jgi:putative addiction module component (TIGR02574 family)
MNDGSTLSPSAQLILSEALTWSISDRLALIERILSSFDKDDPAVDPQWLKEAESRLAAYRSGDLAAVDAEQVFDGVPRPLVFGKLRADRE